MKILLADDNLIMRRIIKGAAEMLGYDTLEAQNGSEAISLLDSNAGNVALICLDWNMPTMDGFEALLNIRSKSEYNDIPILMVTTESEKKNVLKAIQSGANNYLAKPFEREELAKKMVECLALEAGA